MSNHNGNAFVRTAKPTYQRLVLSSHMLRTAIHDGDADNGARVVARKVTGTHWMPRGLLTRVNILNCLRGTILGMFE